MSRKPCFSQDTHAPTSYPSILEHKSCHSPACAKRWRVLIRMSERHMVKTSLSPITHTESHQYIPKITAVNDTWLQRFCIQDPILTGPSFMQEETTIFWDETFSFQATFQIYTPRLWVFFQRDIFWISPDLIYSKTSNYIITCSLYPSYSHSKWNIRNILLQKCWLLPWRVEKENEEKTRRDLKEDGWRQEHCV